MSMNDLKHISSLSLTHGQVLSVIENMRIVEWLDRAALDSVLKKFRREKVPDFSTSGQQGRQGAEFAYRYEHLIDCVVAMKYMGVYSMQHPAGMVRLSQLATEAVRLAGHAPVIKRGRKS